MPVLVALLEGVLEQPYTQDHQLLNSLATLGTFMRVLIFDLIGTILPNVFETAWALPFLHVA